MNPEFVPHLTDKIWFSPANVICHFRELEKQGKLTPTTKGYKKACEAFIAAVSLVGVIKAEGKDYWMQIVGDEEGSPDIRTACYEKVLHDNDFSYQDIEIVKYGIYSNIGLVDFLAGTKLSKKKAYDSKTLILCHIEKPVELPSFAELNRDLINRNLRGESPIVVIGRMHRIEEVYTMAQIYPSVNFVLPNFDVVKECVGRPQRNLKINRSARGDLEFKDAGETHYPFEKLGIK